MVNKLPLTREEVPKKVYSWRWATKMSGFLPAFLFVSRQSYVLIYIPPKISAKNCNIFLHGVFLWAALPFRGDWRALLRSLRRQHCSSLCSQSEGHEHVANIANALWHDFVEFLAVFGRHNIRPPHFASKVSYSAAPQTFAEGSRDVSCCSAAPPCYLAQNRAEIFLDFEHPIYQAVNANANSPQKARSLS